MTVYSHKCPCGAIYTDNDPDIYFCPSCLEQRKAMYAEIDKRLPPDRSKIVESDWQRYQRIIKEKGFVMLNDFK